MPRRPFRVRRSFAGLVLAVAGVAIGGAGTLAAPPVTVVSIKPVHALVSAVMEGIAAPDLLIPGTASPHTITLRPVDARKLERAELIIWIGEAMETFLARPLATLPHGARIIAAIDIPGLTLLKARRGGGFEADLHEHDRRPGPTKAAPSDTDGHLWLDVGNARRIAAAAAMALAEMDPANGGRYRSNLGGLDAELAALDAELGGRLAPIRGRPFLVFHDAYAYLEARYGLAAAGSILVSPERRPSAKRIAEIRAKVTRSGARCLFREPQFSSHLVDTVAEGTSLRIAVLDPLGADIAPGRAAYFTLMRQLAESLTGCLGPA